MAENMFNDIMYNEVLTSDGFVVDYAVCTTYSLDMPTLLSVPFMLGTMGELTEETLKSPHYILEAINRSASKFIVFCNAGSIAVPQNIKSNIYSLLEQSIVQIGLGKSGKGWVNFHPKMWVIKETNPDTEECRIKVIVMSRNLANSNDLDVVCELSGVVKERLSSKSSQKKHAPLMDFLTWLKDRANGKLAKNHIDELCDCIEHVQTFDLDDSQFDDYDFYPMGIDGYDGEETCLVPKMLNHGGDMLLISPFIDMPTIQKFVSSRTNTRKTLITRHASVTEEILQLMNESDGVYAVKEVMTDKVEKETTVDIHEKVYYIQNYEGNFLYLGSTNATCNGFKRNVEFLLGLRFKPYRTGYYMFRSELIYEEEYIDFGEDKKQKIKNDCMFERVLSVPVKESQAEDVTAELQLRQAISAIYNARVTSLDDKRFDVMLRCKKTIADRPIYIHPLYSPGLRKELADSIIFEEISLEKLTEFYVIEADEHTRSVVKIETIGLPHDLRDKAIFKSIINTKTKFINYIAFMLAESPETFIAENSQLEQELLLGASASKEQELSTSLFEDMVRMAYKDPDRIKTIRTIVDKTDRDVIPESFLQMYEQFESTIKQIKRL